MKVLTFTAYGAPVGKGSTRAFVVNGRAIVTHDNAKTKPWQESVAWAALEAARACDWKKVDGPVVLGMTFVLPRPKAAKKRVHHTTRPDLDKLVRLVKDALTRAGVYADDSQVVELVAMKRYEDVDVGLPGVSVHVQTRTPDGTEFVAKL